MSDPLENMIDKRHPDDIIYDMALYPLCNAMGRALAIPQFIDEAVGPKDPRAKLSTGTLAMAFIMNILNQRTPLLHVAESFKNVDCEVLFGPGITNEDLTEARLGTALDDLSEIDQRKLFSRIALHGLHIHGVPVKTTHIDTTNFSVHGEYDSPPDGDFDVTFGNSKDKRKGLKLIGLGVAIQQDLLPVIGQGLSGNGSDTVWFREALDEMADLFTGDLLTHPILVYDAAASNVEMLNKAYEQQMPCIIRLSERFNIAGLYIQKAWEEDRWQTIGQLADHISGQTAAYRITSFKDTIGEGVWRILVIHSSALQKAKETSATRRLPKRKQQLEKKAGQLARKAFTTHSEAVCYAEQFVKDLIGLESPFEYQIRVEEKTVEKYARPGKPTKKDQKIKTTTYHAHVHIGDVDPELYRRWLERESTFVLVDNVPEERLPDEGILKEYNDQWKVEDQFRFLKQPIILGPIWLHRKNRIKSLTFLLLLSMLVAAYLRHRLMVSLAGGPKAQEEKSAQGPVEPESDPKMTASVETPEATISNEGSGESASSSPQVAPAVIESPTDSAEPTVAATKTAHGLGATQEKEANPFKCQDNPKNWRRRVRTIDGRLTERPTFKIIKELLEDTKTICYLENGHWVRKFLQQTRMSTLYLIRNIGFDPAIYIEQFHPNLDLWRYCPMKT